MKKDLIVEINIMFQLEWDGSDESIQGLEQRCLDRIMISYSDLDTQVPEMTLDDTYEWEVE